MKIRPISHFQQEVVSGGSPPTDPDPPATSDMLLWYRGDSLQGSGTATAWNDKTGNGRHLTAYNSPGIATGPNSRQVAQFTRSSQTNFRFATSSTFNVGGGAMSWLCLFNVASFDDATIASPVFNDGDDTSIYTDGFSAANRIGRYGNASNNTLITPDDWYSSYTENAGGGSRWDINNVNIATNNYYQRAWNQLWLGATFYFTPNAFQGYIAEFIAWNRILTGTERDDLWAYVQDYYGIS